MDGVNPSGTAQVLTAVQNYVTVHQQRTTEANLAMLMASAMPPAVLASINGASQAVPAAATASTHRVDIQA
ncbi:MAG: hypothetical protein ACKVVP_20110 [Chloroflexota bacterium]